MNKEDLKKSLNDETTSLLGSMKKAREEGNIGTYNNLVKALVNVQQLLDNLQFETVWNKYAVNKTSEKISNFDEAYLQLPSNSKIMFDYCKQDPESGILKDAKRFQLNKCGTIENPYIIENIVSEEVKSDDDHCITFLTNHDLKLQDYIEYDNKLYGVSYKEKFTKTNYYTAIYKKDLNKNLITKKLLSSIPRFSKDRLTPFKNGIYFCLVKESDPKLRKEDILFIEEQLYMVHDACIKNNLIKIKKACFSNPDIKTSTTYIYLERESNPNLKVGQLILLNNKKHYVVMEINNDLIKLQSIKSLGLEYSKKAELITPETKFKLNNIYEQPVTHNRLKCYCINDYQHAMLCPVKYYDEYNVINQIDRTVIYEM